MSLLVIYASLLVVCFIVVAFLLLTNKEKQLTLEDIIGPLSGTTCKEQTLEVLYAAIENEVLFNLVKEVECKFSGFESIDILNINTSKFAKLVAKYNTLPTQVTSAERYFRTFKSDLYNYVERQA